MKWSIPAKTFLLGEYAAIHDASALLVTTTPAFVISLSTKASAETIHPQSPGGVWWLQQEMKEYSLQCNDPYKGQGGLGASSAQFVGSYLASCYLNGTQPSLKELLVAYYLCAWNQKGLRPSGYDVIAQTQSGCVFINKKEQNLQTYSWPFEDLSFFLIHTGNKLATHQHLQHATLPANVESLSSIVDKAKNAIETQDSMLFVDCINQYHQQLQEARLVAPHSITLINQLNHYPEILAIKGCGALGSDVLLVISASNQAKSLQDKLIQHDYLVLATEDDIAPQNATSTLFSHIDQ